MSAAGALSASIALCDLLDIPAERAFEATHRAEIKNQTGLGDVAAMSTSGVELRTWPGLPPHGRIEKLALEAGIVVSVVGEPIKTSKVLSDIEKRRKISAAGEKCIREFQADPNWEHLFTLGMEFIDCTDLCTPEVLHALSISGRHGMGSMALIGNSIFCMGDVEDLIEALSSLGPTRLVRIDNEGPRLL